MKKLMYNGLICLILGASLVSAQAQDRDAKLRKVTKASAKSPVKNFDVSFLASSEGEIVDLDFIIGDAKSYLLIIAVDKYKYWKSLSNAVKDARDFKKVLLDRYGFDQTNIFELYNEEATLENIEEAFEALKTKGTNQDNLIIYYSGHGYYDPSFDLGYWVPSEGRTNSGATATFIPNDNIRNYIKNLEFRHVFMIADACFSGSLFLTDSRGAEEEKAESIKSRWGLSSGNLEEVQDGEKGKNSPFARYLIEYLQINLNDKLRAKELINYVTENVTKNTQQTPIGNRLSGVGDEGGQYVFVLQGTKEQENATRGQPLNTPSEKEKEKEKEKDKNKK
jgi:hypothetical protein